MHKWWRYALAGGLAGLANGLFGGGGGSVLVPLLTRMCGLEQRRAFATSVAVILPLCLLSVVIYLLRGGLDLAAAWPYLVGGTLGGWLGGRLFRGVKVNWLRRGFGLLLIFGGVRCLL
ncbi:MAG: sulfite exporter TauE/SafE family protein [Oscillospiraceae bacterium]|nr:sulfite exporter TauE/SafE family protein [Oscillospiraceae bacterium]